MRSYYRVTSSFQFDIASKREEWSMLNSNSFEECDRTQVLRGCPGERKDIAVYGLMLGNDDIKGLVQGKAVATYGTYIANGVNNSSATMKEIEVVLELGLFRSRNLGLRYDQGNVLLHWIRC
jgi:hypothetical protein